jgi:hypothetical protein
MPSSVGTLEDHLRDAYTSTNKDAVRTTALYLDAYSRKTLSRVTLVGCLERAEALLDVAEDHFVASFTNERSRRIHEHVFRALSDCYEPIVDDVLLISAFEMYAKASLLRRGFAVHEISAPKDLRDTQRSKPIHRNTLRARKRTGANVAFKEGTIGLSTLLSKEYEAKYPMPTDVKKGLGEARRRRNLVHFQTALMWAVTRDLVAFATHLNSKVPVFVNGRRKRAT